jgi:hypothetical protein
MKFNCINFGGCYGYDLIAVFEEFVMEHCVFTMDKPSYPSVDRLAFEYIFFLKENYDNSIEYLEKQNKNLLLKLITLHNKMPGKTKFIIEENTIINVCLNMRPIKTSEE